MKDNVSGTSVSNKEKVEAIELDFLSRASSVSRLEHISNEEIRQ